MSTRLVYFGCVAAFACVVPLSVLAQTNNCSGNDEVNVPKNTSVTFTAQQHRDEKAKFSLMSNRKGRWLTDLQVQDVSFENHNDNPLNAQDNLYAASADGFCVKAPGWWQWGGGPQNHQDWKRVEKTVTTKGAVVRYFEDDSDDPGGILTMTFHHGS